MACQVQQPYLISPCVCRVAAAAVGGSQGVIKYQGNVCANIVPLQGGKRNSQLSSIFGMHDHHYQGKAVFTEIPILAVRAKWSTQVPSKI